MTWLAPIPTVVVLGSSCGAPPFCGATATSAFDTVFCGGVQDGDDTLKMTGDRLFLLAAPAFEKSSRELNCGTVVLGCGGGFGLATLSSAVFWWLFGDFVESLEREFSREGGVGGGKTFGDFLVKMLGELLLSGFVFIGDFGEIFGRWGLSFMPRPLGRFCRVWLGDLDLICVRNLLLCDAHGRVCRRSLERDGEPNWEK